MLEDERGGVISGWLMQMLAILAVIGLIAYEAIAIVVSNVSADDSAREVARAARDAYRVEQSIEQAEDTAHEVALERGVLISTVAVDDEEYLLVEVERQAPTLLLHRIGATEDLATTTGTSRVRWAN